MNNSYGVYPFEPSFFNLTYEVSIQDQIPNINAVEPNFAGISLNTKVDSNISNVMKFLEEIKQSDSVSLRVKDLEDYDVSSFHGKLCISLSLNENGFPSIQRLLSTKLQKNPNFETLELRDIPKNVREYNEYKNKIATFLGTINYSNTSLHTATFLKELLDTNFSTKPYSINFDQYGVCSSLVPKLNDLYNYYIDSSILRDTVKKLGTIKLNIAETDSICSQTNGISNTFGSCLWLLDFLFQVAKGNIYKTYVSMKSTFDSNIYPLITFSYATRNNAVFYDHSSIYPADTVEPNVSIYITKNIKEYFVTVIHKDITQENVQIKMKLPTKTDATLIRLQSNQTAIGTNGITFGEFTFTDSKDGSPKRVGLNQQPIKPEGNIYTFIVTRLSAAVLCVPVEITGGSLLENINKEDESNAIITVRPDAREEDSIPITMSVRNFEKMSM